MSSSVNVADADEFPRPWSLVVRGATWLQLAFGVSFISVILLYGFARLTLGSHGFVTGGGNDPKDLGAGLGNLLARALHALGAAAAVVSPFTGVVLGSLVLLGYCHVIEIVYLLLLLVRSLRTSVWTQRTLVRISSGVAVQTKGFASVFQAVT